MPSVRLWVVIRAFLQHCLLRVWDWNKLGGHGPLLAFLYRGLPLWLLAWFFPKWTEPLLSVLKKPRFISQRGCKTSDTGNQHGYSDWGGHHGYWACSKYPAKTGPSHLSPQKASVKPVFLIMKKKKSIYKIKHNVLSSLLFIFAADYTNLLKNNKVTFFKHLNLNISKVVSTCPV